MEREIYYDNSATTRVRDEVASHILSMMTQNYGNPSSLHRKGFHAQQQMELARKEVAQSLGCDPSSITFTSGGTESDNLAILGAAQAMKRQGDHIITTAIEHDAVLRACRHLEEAGWRITYLKPDREGNVTVQQVLDAIEDKTVLVSIMAVNNEVGSILPIGEIAKEVRRVNKNILIHTDCVQAYGKHPIKVGKNLDVDFLTVSGHKIYAPKGVGALYVKKGAKIKPVLFGGGQEKNLRPGTENIASICGMGMAARLLCSEMKENQAHIQQIHDALLTQLQEISGICINSPENGTPYILNFSVEGVRSEIMLHFLEDKGIYLSSGSACAKGEASHVLLAMGMERKRADSALRLSFGRYNTMEEIPIFLDALKEGIARLRR